jgi:hypothetical protein
MVRVKKPKNQKMKLITYIMTVVTMLVSFALADAAKTNYVVGMTGVT